jgi:DNA invertase Pin-like site-specific DNA recombinase
MKKIAYLRVSTADQRPDRQILGLRNLADELHIETISAVAKKRPVYEAVLARLQPGDMLIVWSIDRAYRSVKDAVNELDALKERGIKFHIAGMNIDMDTADGRYQYNSMSANVQWEREKLVERTKEGIDAARARGQRIGRPPKLTDIQLFEAHYRIATGAATRAQVAAEHQIWPWTLTRALKRSMQELPN